jgi:hypothetical protein
MADNIDPWALLARVLFYGDSAIFLIVTILAFVAYHRVTRGKRILELLLIWGVSTGGSMAGSILIGILGYYFGEVDEHYTLLLATATW